MKQVKLEKESEVRIEVGNDTPLRLRVLNGNAEIFGTELPPEIWLEIARFAVAPEWKPTSFHPPQDKLHVLNAGFEKTCVMFQGIYESLKYENVRVSSVKALTTLATRRSLRYEKMRYSPSLSGFGLELILPQTPSHRERN